jgi:hypothetical protein
LIRDEEATLAAYMHTLKAGVPASDDAVCAVGEGDGLVAVHGGVELRSVEKVSGVVDGVPLLGGGELAGADLGVDPGELIADRGALGCGDGQSWNLGGEGRQGDGAVRCGCCVVSGCRCGGVVNGRLWGSGGLGSEGKRRKEQWEC